MGHKKEKALKEMRLLDEKLNKLLSGLKGYPQEELNMQPGVDQWSALQICHHLLLSEKFSLDYLKKKISNNDQIETGGLMSMIRFGILRLALKSPLKFKSVRVVDNDRFPGQSTLDDVEVQWLDVRQEFRSFLLSLQPSSYSWSLYKHPRAGRLTLKQMIIFFHDHFDRHKKQIERALKVASKEKVV